MSFFITNEEREKIHKNNYLTYDKKIYIKNSILCKDLYEQNIANSRMYRKTQYQYYCIHNKELEIRVQTRDLVHVTDEDILQCEFWGEFHQYEVNHHQYPDGIDREYRTSKIDIYNLTFKDFNFHPELDEKWIKALYL